MKIQAQWQEMLKKCPLGKGYSSFDTEDQENPSANKQPSERKKKIKSKLGLIKG